LSGTTTYSNRIVGRASIVGMDVMSDTSFPHPRRLFVTTDRASAWPHGEDDYRFLAWRGTTSRATANDSAAPRVRVQRRPFGPQSRDAYTPPPPASFASARGTRIGAAT
jgi:hypothetical protein